MPTEGEAVRPKVPKIAHKHDGAHGTEIEFEEGETVRPSVISELERLRSECCTCEKCGHVQAEPNWCHECGHRVTWSEWAIKWEADIRRQAQEGYWAADEVLEALRGHGASWHDDGSARIDGDEYAHFLERRFSGEGAS